MNIRYYTLLYVDLDEKRQLQGMTRAGKERIKIFLRNAALLNKSLLEIGKSDTPLIILTNNKALLQELSTEISYHDYEIEEIEFLLNVPKGIKFYSAHFKIDVFRYLSTKSNDEYSILLDNDIVLLKPLPDTFDKIVAQHRAICYHISEYDIDMVMHDCRLIMPDVNVVEWCGGEFIGGVNSFWEELYQKCMNISESYFANLDKNLFHVGDEMLTSIAIAEMSANGWHVLDAGNLKLVKRYWGANEMVKICNLKTSFVHMPADKVWLASLPLDKIFSKADFVDKYDNHWRKFRLLFKIKRMLGK